MTVWGARSGPRTAAPVRFSSRRTRSRFVTPDGPGPQPFDAHLPRHLSDPHAADRLLDPVRNQTPASNAPGLHLHPDRFGSP